MAIRDEAANDFTHAKAGIEGDDRAQCSAICQVLLGAPGFTRALAAARISFAHAQVYKRPAPENQALLRIARNYSARDAVVSTPLSRDRIRTKCRPVTRRSAIFVLLALALLLAPLGVCLSGGAAMAASHTPGMHHASPSPSSHSDHRIPGKPHYCPDCQPPSFVKSGKVATPDVAPLSAALAPVVPTAQFAFAPTKSVWARAPSPRPPPLRRTYRIRLQI